MTSLKDFPGAPADAVLTEEGWLIRGDEAWTVEDWDHAAQLFSLQRRFESAARERARQRELRLARVSA